MKINFRALYLILIPLIIWTLIRLYFHSRYSFGGDEAEYFNNAWRVYCGNMPYKDFWLLFPPAEVYMPAFFFRLFGVHLNLIFYGSIITALSAVLLFFVLLKELKCTSLFALLVGLLLVLQGEFFFFSVLCLLSCYFLLRYDSKGSWYILAVSGLIAGVALLFRIYQVAPYCISALAFLFIRKKEVKEKVKEVLILVLSALIPVIVTAILLFSIDGKMFDAIVIDAVSHGTALHISYWNEITENWKKLFTYYNYSSTKPALYPLQGMALMSSRFLSGLLIRIIPFVVLACFLADILSRKIDSSFNRKLLFVIWGIIYLPYAINLSGSTHLMQAYMPFLILFYLYIYNAFTGAKFITIKYALISCFIIVLFNSTIIIYEIFKPNHFKEYTLTTSAGTLQTSVKEEYEADSIIISTIDNNTSGNDYIFALSWNALPFYALTGRQNPSYYDSPIDLLLRTAKWKEDNIINDIQLKKPRVILVENNIELINGISFDTDKTLPFLITFIKNNYKLSGHYNLYDVYLLK